MDHVLLLMLLAQDRLLVWKGVNRTGRLIACKLPCQVAFLYSANAQRGRQPETFVAYREQQ